MLGRRDRAALNENFARELPLEYRAILKDYYDHLDEKVEEPLRVVRLGDDYQCGRGWRDRSSGQATPA